MHCIPLCFAVIISDMFAEATLSMKLACLDGSSSSLRDIALKVRTN